MSLEQCAKESSSQVVEGKVTKSNASNSTLTPEEEVIRLSPPWGVWLEYLGQLDGDSDPLYIDLYEAVLALASMDFRTIPGAVRQWAETSLTPDAIFKTTLEMLKNIGTLLAPFALAAQAQGTILLERAFESARDYLTSVAISGLDSLLGIYNAALVRLLNAVDNMRRTLPAAFANIAATLGTEILKVTSDFFTAVLQLSVRRDDEEQQQELEQCIPSLLQCQMNSLATTVMPTVVGAVVTMHPSDGEL